MESELLIEGIHFPKFSCREIKQTFKPIVQGELRRTVNGDLCYVGASLHHKYHSTLRCQDRFLPSFQQAWVGAEVRVFCVSSLWERVNMVTDSAPALSRPAVANSVTIQPDPDGTRALVCYRPILRMRITGFEFVDGEWEEGAGWRLDLEEI
jgi:hypothetical protein